LIWTRTQIPEKLSQPRYSPATLRPTQRGCAATKLKTEPNHEGHEDHEVQKYNMNESIVAFVYYYAWQFSQLAQIFGFKILRYSSRQEREARQDSEFILFSLRSLRALREIFRNLVAALPRCALRGESVFSRGFDKLTIGTPVPADIGRYHFRGSGTARTTNW
jgi:hypothetical protein